jgi:TonB family protein
MRLQNRCLLTSAAVHASLLALLVFAPAFRRESKDLITPPLELVPGELIDAALAPGLAPLESSAPPKSDVTAEVREPQRQPAPAPIVRQPRPPTREEPPEVETAPQSTTRKEPPVRAQRDRPKLFDFSKATSIKPTKTSRSASKSSAADNQASSQMRSLERRLAEAAGSISSARNSSTIRISTPGGGGGGRGSVNAWNVRNAYDLAWVTPTRVTDELATAEVEVVIRGDGSVAEARMVRKSGIAALDRSVEDAMRKVKRIDPFQSFAPDETVTFTIGFNLQSRRQF